MNTIKAIIFDLDGVLVDTKKIHYESLNKALLRSKINYQISYKDHINKFDGLPTQKKLEILIKEKKIRESFSKKIIKYKNYYTTKELSKINYNIILYNIIKKLSKKYKIAIASNAIHETLSICIKKLRIKKFLSYKISNGEINFAKPHPEIYLRCFLALGIKPSEALILEDSHVGRLAALESGGNLMPIKEINEVNLKNILFYLNNLNKKVFNINKKNFWIDKEMNILIPMAGAGKRFSDAGYIFPKPLIEIEGKPMIQWVIDNLNIKANYIFLVQKEHVEKFNIQSLLKILEPNSKIIVIDKLTEGAACTTLLAKNLINNNCPLIISNSDQFIEWDSSKSIYNFLSKKIDGAILTFKSTHPKWSYAKADKNNKVIEVAEKKVISDNATVGIYYWKYGSDYVKYAEQMIKKNIRTNNEFYVCPVYNEAIIDNKNITIHNVSKMWGLGTPEDLSYFQKKYLDKI
jgi:HAD superfamily hydrolase (TIGR01509 family)